MERRGTAHMIEPEIYTMYVLTLKHGIAPHRAIEMWLSPGTILDNPKRGLKIIIGKILERYWEIHGLKYTPDYLAKSKSFMRFLRKHEVKPSMFERIMRYKG